jgi:hypothetical protein
MKEGIMEVSLRWIGTLSLTILMTYGGCEPLEQRLLPEEEPADPQNLILCAEEG